MDDVVGVRTWSRAVGTMMVTCPREGARVEGWQLELRDWQTVLGRRVFPSELRDRLVECGSCHATYPQRVLDVREEPPPTRGRLWAEQRRVPSGM